MDMVDLATAMARGPLMLKLTMVLTVLATEAMAMAVLAMAMARGLLMPMLTTAATAMVVMDMVDLATAMARGPLMRTMEATAMAVLATAMALIAMASNSTSQDLHNLFLKKTLLQISVLDLNLLIGKLNCNYELPKLKYTQILKSLSKKK